MTFPIAKSLKWTTQAPAWWLQNNVFSSCLVYRPIKASCATVWPNQKGPALLDSKCSQLKFNTRLKELSPPTTSDHYRIHALSWMDGQCIDRKKPASHFGPKERGCHVRARTAARGGFGGNFPSTNPERSRSGFPYWQCRRRLSTTCGGNPHLMGQQRRNPTHVLLDDLHKSGN